MSKYYIDTIVENQLEYNNNSRGMLHCIKGMTPITTARILNNWYLDDIIGIQPFSDPVQSAYRLEYKHDSEGKMSLEIAGHTTEVGSKKLQSGIAGPVEWAQDLYAEYEGDQHEAHAVMANVFSLEVIEEISAEVVQDLKRLATLKKEPMQVGRFYDEKLAKSFRFVSKEQAMSKAATVLTAINQASNKIAGNAKRGAGNFAILGKNAFEQLVVGAELDAPIQAHLTTEVFSHNALLPVGFHRGQIKLYTSSVLGEDEILVGYKGGVGHVDVGYVYCPYVPLMNNGVVVNPVTFQQYASFFTRYGKCVSLEDEGPSNSANYYELIKL